MSEYTNRSSAGAASSTAGPAPGGADGAVGKRTMVDALGGGAQPMESPRGDLDAGAPAQPADAAANPFQPIIDKATGGPIEFEGEKAWLLDGKFFSELLTSMTKRDLGGLPIGGMKGWLNVTAKPAIVKGFQSKADGPNNTGLFTYQGNYLLWRHAIHHNHNPNGGPENTGTYDAFEGYKLPPDIMAKYDAKKKK
jgi:hypothetical protein